MNFPRLTATLALCAVCASAADFTVERLSVAVNTNGVITDPANFFAANSNGLNAAISTNSAAKAGVVPAGTGNAGKVWKTDGSGNPAWRDDADSGTSLLSISNNWTAAQGFSGGLTTLADPYDAGWNGANTVPTQNDVYDAMEALRSSKQDASANLAAWSAVATSAKQDAHANLTSVSTNSFTGTGTIPLSSVTDGKAAGAASSTANSYVIFSGTGGKTLANQTNALSTGEGMILHRAMTNHNVYRPGVLQIRQTNLVQGATLGPIEFPVVIEAGDAVIAQISDVEGGHGSGYYLGSWNNGAPVSGWYWGANQQLLSGTLRFQYMGTNVDWGADMGLNHIDFSTNHGVRLFGAQPELLMYKTNGPTDAKVWSIHPIGNGSMVMMTDSSSTWPSPATNFVLSKTGTLYTPAHTVDDASYDASDWNGSTNVPTRNAVRDEIEVLRALIAAGALPDGDYGDVTISEGGTIISIDSGAILASEVTHSYSPQYYTPSGSPSSALSSHLVGIDSALGSQTGSLLTNGTRAMSADLPMGGYKLTGLGGIDSASSLTITIPTSSILSLRQAAGQPSWYYTGRDANGNGYWVLAGANRISGADSTEFVTATVNSNGITFAPAKGGVVVSSGLTVSGNSVLSGNASVGGALTVQGTDILQELSDLADDIPTSVSHLTAAGTNTSESAFTKLTSAGPFKFTLTQSQASVANFDWQASYFHQFTLTNDTAFNPINIAGGASMIWGAASNSTATTVVLDWGNVLWTTKQAPTALGAGKELHFRLWTLDGGTTIKGSWESEQDTYLQEAFGGTYTPNGEAVAPRTTVYYPTPYSTTNIDLVMSSGRKAKVIMNGANVWLNQISGLYASTNLSLWQELEVYNAGASTYGFGARSDIRKSWSGLTNIAAGETLVFHVEFTGNVVSNGQIYVKTKLLAAGAGGGGGSTLWDGLDSAYTFESSSNSILHDVFGTQHLYTYASGAIKTGSNGVNGLCWYSDSGNGWATNNYSALEPNAGDRTWTGWVKFGGTGSRAIAGQYSTGDNQRSWALIADSGNLFQVYASTSGSSLSTNRTVSTETVTTGVWYFFAVTIDDNQTIRATVCERGDTWIPLTTVVPASTLHNSTAPTGLMAYGGTAPVNGGIKWMDEVYTFDVIKSDADLESLFNEEFHE